MEAPEGAQHALPPGKQAREVELSDSLQLEKTKIVEGFNVDEDDVTRGLWVDANVVDTGLQGDSTDNANTAHDTSIITNEAPQQTLGDLENEELQLLERKRSLEAAYAISAAEALASDQEHERSLEKQLTSLSSMGDDIDQAYIKQLSRGLSHDMEEAIDELMNEGPIVPLEIDAGNDEPSPDIANDIATLLDNRVDDTNFEELKIEAPIDQEEALPAFANAANVALYAKVRATAIAVRAARARSADETARAKRLSAHRAFVAGRLASLEGIARGRAADVATAKERLGESERARRALAGQIKALESRREALRAERERCQKQNENAQNEVKSLAARLDVAVTELTDWCAVQARAVEERASVEDVQGKATAAVRTLELSLSKQRDIVLKEQKSCTKISDILLKQRLEAQGHAKALRELAGQRAAIQQAWSKSVAAAGARDAELRALGGRADAAAERRRAKQRALERLRMMLSVLGQNLRLRRGELLDLERKRSALTDDLAVGRRRYEASSERCIAAGARRAALETELEQANKKVALVEEQAAARQRETARVRAEEGRAREQLAQAKENAALENEQAEVIAQLTADIRGGAELVTRATAEHEAALEKERTAGRAAAGRRERARARLHACRGVVKNVASAQSRMRARRVQLEKLLYNVEFQLQGLQRAHATLKGELRADERDALVRTRSELTDQLGLRTADLQLLTNQQLQLEQALQSGNAALAEAAAAHKAVLEATALAEARASNAARRLAPLSRERDRRTLEVNTLRLRLQRLRGLLAAELSGVDTLQERQAAFDQSARAQTLAAEQGAAQLALARRALAEERRRAARSLAERRQAATAAYARFCVLAGGAEGGVAAQLVALAAEEEALRAKRSAVEGEVAKAADDVAKLRAVLVQCQAKTATLQEGLKSETCDKSNLEAEVLALRSSARTLEQQLGGLKRAEGALEAGRADAHAAAEAAETQCRSARVATATAKKALETALSQNAAARSRLAMEVKSGKVAMNQRALVKACGGAPPTEPLLLVTALDKAACTADIAQEQTLLALQAIAQLTTQQNALDGLTKKLAPLGINLGKYKGKV